MDFTVKRKKYGGKEAFEKLLTKKSKSPQKIVILSHDIAFRPGGPRNEEEELKTFLRYSKQSGYAFRTLNTYVTDNIKNY